LGASLKKSLKMTENNIEDIVANKELLNYIRGEKRYSNDRPEVDYGRWRSITNYLASHRNSDISKQIINILIELLDGKKWQDVYAVAGICQNIDLPVIDEKFEQLMLDARFFSFPDNVVSLTSKYAMKKRLDAVTKLVMENAVRKKHVDWVVTLVSRNSDEQLAYWDYCDKILDSVLPKLSEKEKVFVLEKVSFWKARIMTIIHQINEER
jgi:hypothetical protein